EVALEPLELEAELAVQLVAADAREVVALRVEEGVLEVRARRLDVGRLARSGPLVDLDQRLFARRDELTLLLPLALEEHHAVRELEMPHEAVDEAGVGLLVVAQRPQQHEEAEPPLARHAGARREVLARLGLDVELDPLPAVRVDRAGDERLGVAAGLK